MAEKRGQFIYNDDGSISQLVHNTNETAENSTIGIDHQATLTNTAVTHTSAAVAPSTTNTQSAWQLVPEGMTEFVNNLTSDVGAASIYVNVIWSEDGTNIIGKTEPTVSASSAQAQKTSTQWYPIGGSFYRTGVWNGHTAPITTSANIKFRP